MSEMAPSESLYGHEPPPLPLKAPHLWEQIVGIFTEPVALFKRLETTPVWGGALTLMTGLMVIFLLIAVVYNALVLLQVNAYWQGVFVGALILAATALDGWFHRKLEGPSR